ncbi:MAG: hypothetical protein U5K74_05705 [Gemmatimonadaceae bacterium]|nr:hypothetical protein [Gemmatimonadaceae bacterium]
MDGYVGRTAIPVGLYRSGGTESPVFLDADFLLGPEAAHLNISGVSGLATKTSAVEWLLQSIFAHFPADKGSVAAVCFNVKGPDLCFLDQPATLAPEDRAMYERLGVPAEPFRNVQYYAPYDAALRGLATIRSNEALQHNVQPLTWGLKEVAAVRRGAAQQGRHGCQGRCADRLHHRSRGGPEVPRSGAGGRA